MIGSKEVLEKKGVLKKDQVTLTQVFSVPKDFDSSIAV